MNDRPDFEGIALTIKSSQFIQEEAKKLLDAYHQSTNQVERKYLIGQLEAIQVKMQMELQNLLILMDK